MRRDERRDGRIVLRAFGVIIVVLLIVGAIEAITSHKTGLTGFGASVSAWNAHHHADDRFTPGTAYDAKPGLGLANGTSDQYDDRYYAVDTSGGPVLDYSMRLYPGTTIHQAKAEAMREFPSDAHVDWFQTKGTCAQMQVSSATLRKADGPSPVAAMVEFTSAGSYSSQSVTQLLLVGLPPTDAVLSPGC